jgi:quinohemoprotein ethanol dehydrogenase
MTLAGFFGLFSLAGCDSGTNSESSAPTSETSTQAPASLAPELARGNVDDARIIAAPQAEPGSWLSYGQTYKEQRFSKLTQITRDNVDELGLAWTREIGDFNMRMQGTPIVVDGVMYASNGWSVVFALDATTGEEIWRYDPEVDRDSIRLACCGPAHNRGVAVYEGKVYVGTFDGRLVAIDATTGTLVWDVDTYHPSGLGRFNVTGAPRAAAGKIYIGQGSSESGHRRGYVTAYDAETGEVAWRFYLVPGDPNEPFEHPEMEMAAKTWGGEWWKFGGGGTAWNSLVYDEDFNSLYIGVGNGAPWPRQIRSGNAWSKKSPENPLAGDDLFLTAIVSVDVETGRMNWFYQTVPGDNWDYSSAMDMTLTEMEVDGKMTKVLLQAPKNGFFYVIDRSNGKVLRAHPYTEGITWATHVDLETGRPIENPAVRYEEDPQWILPANAGAHNWEPQSWDEEQGIMYFYYHDYANFYSLAEEFVKTGIYKIRERGLSLGWGEGEYRRKLEAQAAPRPESKGFVGAFDPLTGEYKWRHRLESVFNGGVLATTTGLLFQGEGNGQFVVRDTDTGEPIWSYDALGSFSSSIMSYQIDDTQYVATMVTGNRSIDLGGTVLVFKLGGQDTLDVGEIADVSVPEQPEIEIDYQTYTKGDQLYHAQCASCHGGIGIPTEVATIAPDLRLMTLETHGEYEDIVLGGSRADKGMAGFAEDLGADDIEAIRMFLVGQANQLRQWQEGREDDAEREAENRG